MSDGTILTWSLPFFEYEAESGISIKQDVYDFVGNKYREVKSVLFDIFLPFADNTSAYQSPYKIEKESNDLFGIVFHDGGFPHGYGNDESELLLGPIPSDHCRFVFYVGQGSCHIHQNLSSNLQLYGLTDCIVGPPTFVSSLFIDLLADNSVSKFFKTYLHNFILF